MYLVHPTVLDPGVYSAANTNEYKRDKVRFLGIIAQLECKADNLTAICEPTF
jgi:hypothetical protein